MSRPIPKYDVGSLFQQAKSRRLDLRALRAGYDSQNLALRKAVRDRFPSLQLGLFRTTDTANNQTLGPSLSLTLPVWNRNRGQIAEAAAARDALRAEYAARLLQTRSEIATLVRQLDIAHRQLAEEREKVIALRSSEGDATGAAARGDLSSTAAIAARQAANDRLIALIALDQTLLEQTVSLELAVGGPLP
jgi:outer membrane protein TolC